MKFYRIWFKAILFFFSVYLSGCGDKKVLSSVETLETEAFANPQELNQVLNRWKVECTDSTNCPSTVGQILITDGKSLGLCTGTLIDSNYVITNSHCFNFKDDFSNEFISPEKLCQSGTRIVFASNSAQGSEQLFCQKVLKKSVINGIDLKADYLIFEVKNSKGRNSDVISRKGLPDQEKLTLRKVSPVRRGYGSLSTTNCQVIHSTILAPSSQNPLQEVHVLGGCESVQGNSGSSLIDSEGKVRALLFKGFTNSFYGTLTSFQSEVRSKAVKLKTILATNLSCLDFVFKNEDKSVLELCRAEHKNQGSIFESLNSEEVKKSFESQKTFLTRDLQQSNSFGQDLQFVNKERSFYYSPKCLKKGVVNPTTHFLNLFVLTPIFIPELGVRDNLTTFVKGFKKDSQACSITLAPSQFFRFGQGSVRISGPGCVNSQGNVVLDSVDTWSLCPTP